MAFSLTKLFSLPSTSTPRWIIVFVDLFLSLSALFAAYLIRFDVYSNASEIFKEWEILKVSLPFIVLIKLAVFYVFKIHKGLIRFTSFEDIRRIFLAVATSTLVILIVGLIRFYLYDERYLMPMSVLFVEFLASVLLLIGFRFTVKVFYYETTKGKAEPKPIIIYGAGVSGLVTKRTLEKDTRLGYELLAFIDDNKKLTGNRLEGTTIYHTSDLEKLITDHQPKEVIVAIQRPDKGKVAKVVDVCLKNSVNIQAVPNLKSWINGEFSVKQIQKVNIEELLGRDPIVLNQERLEHQLNGKRILVTGAAGSIGSGLVRQLANYNPESIILLDQAESALYDFHNELVQNEKGDNLEVVIGDIRSYERMNNLFATLQPQIVFHAAAYKHVPLMEMNPSEAIHTNVKGTKIIIDLADKYHVEKFVMISTDKAVNPTNVMGASKRISEMYAQLMNSDSKTQYITTRFGNVLGSNGSVIPLFKRQIANGGPVTVTDENVTRFFMTIPEACQLVLEACSMGEGGEIFVFDMGESVKIIDLAKKMIQLSGLELGKDIEIKVTGLRPGEKLYEELLANEENTLTTHHPQILRAKLRDESDEKVKEINNLIDLFEGQNNLEIVKQMKRIVPEFKSNNSQYTQLDE
jgi:FlaA1/EpsC-like NDP-sugar epimerase